MRGPRPVWQLTQPISYPAQGGRVEALLAALATLEWKDRIADQELKDRPDAQEQYGFTQPQFSILLQGAGMDHRLEVGDLSPMGDEVFLSLSAAPQFTWPAPTCCNRFRRTRTSGAIFRC